MFGVPLRRARVRKIAGLVANFRLVVLLDGL
jgi:hypothetical protein